jgi:integrase
MLIDGEAMKWSIEKQAHLQEHLTGLWAEDDWILTPTNPKRDRCHLRFMITSPPLKAEVKYAVWRKFDSGQWKMNTDQKALRRELAFIIQWLNHFPSLIQSLMEKNLEQWDMSLRSYIVQTGRLQQRRQKVLLSTQEYVERVGEDPRILLFRQLYAIIQNAYDDRPALEQDVWDLRKMGLGINLAGSHHILNFTPISQPWLRQVAKQFMKYWVAVRSPGDCSVKLEIVRGFSQFLGEQYPAAGISDIDRAMIIKYIAYLREHQLSESWRKLALSTLRTIIETCAYQLGVDGLTREQIISDADYPKQQKLLSREIPEEVLKQLRERIESLDTTTARMIVILLECGMRISELCTLSTSCLIHDDRNEWYLCVYQVKTKKEHIIPIINHKVIEVIQAQQRTTREQWGESCPYLFPSVESHVLPYKTNTFVRKLNEWAIATGIRDSAGRLYRFQTHQFRHTVGMRLINDDIPLDVISRLLGHYSIGPTQVYARKRPAKLREELERAARKRKTVNHKGEVVAGDVHANDTDAKLLLKEVRGQTLPIGGCGRPVFKGGCDHANKCLTCPLWLTSTEDLPRLKAFLSKAIQLRQRAAQSGNEVVVQNQDRIIPNLALRIAKLEDTSMDGALSVEELLAQLRTDLVEVASSLEEAREAGRLLLAKQLERITLDIRARISALEGSL